MLSPRLLGAACFGATQLHTLTAFNTYGLFSFLSFPRSLALWISGGCAPAVGSSNGPLDLCRSGGVMGNPHKPISDVLLLHTDAAADTIRQSLIQSRAANLAIA